MILISLFFSFFRIGLLAVGGGLATLPFLYDLAEQTGWFTHSDVTNLIAISESTPGPIGVNAATYVGFLSDGFAGAVTATLGLIAPAILVILMVSKVLERFQESVLVQRVFSGLRPASTALIASAGLTVMRSVFFRGAVICWQQVIFAVLLWILTQKTSWHPALYIGLAAVVGIVFRMSG